MKDKIALFCDIDKKAVIECRDADHLLRHPTSAYKHKIWINRL